MAVTDEPLAVSIAVTRRRIALAREELTAAVAATGMVELGRLAGDDPVGMAALVDEALVRLRRAVVAVDEAVAASVDLECLAAEYGR
jgi:hypothetical protein